MPGRVWVTCMVTADFFLKVSIFPVLNILSILFHKLKKKESKQTNRKTQQTNALGACTLIFISSLILFQMVKSLLAVQETSVQSLGQEDQEKEMATHFITLAWKSHGWRNLAGCSSWDRKELDTTK